MDVFETLKRCSGCRRYLYLNAFLSATSSEPFKTCVYCRYRQTPRMLVNREDMISLGELGQHYPKIELIEVDGINERFMEFDFQGFIECTELETLSLNDAADNVESIKSIIKDVVAAVEACDGYVYYVKDIGQPRKQKTIHFTAYCAQDEQIQRQETSETARTRRCRRMNTYSCDGHISGVVDMINHCVHISIKHNNIEQHPPPPASPHHDQEMNDEIRRFIHDRVHNQEDVSTIYRQLIASYPLSSVTVGQIYYWWNIAMQQQYKLDENQFNSSRMLIERSPGFQEVYYKSDVEQGIVAIGFTTPLFLSIANCSNIEEFFIDSTYKTNRVDVELFGIVASVNGVGYPVAYMLYGKTAGMSEEAEENAKAVTLREWFICMKEIGFNPTFFFSDKDAATMQAINTVFRPGCLRLCLWHMLRAINKKLASQKLANPAYTIDDARAATVVLTGNNNTTFEVSVDFLPSRVSRNGIICQKSLRDQLQEMIRKHYHMHPLIPEGYQFKSAEEIYIRCCREVYEFCYQYRIPDAWAYLYKRWYCPERWTQWSRASIAHAVPAGKTTMFIESHWKVMKRHHLYRFNRARLDLLTFVIIERHCRALMYKFNREVLHRHNTSRWEQLFCTEWNKCVVRTEEVEVMNDYYKDTETWVCGCPYFWRSRFFICKHLVSEYGIGRIAPRERFILRRSLPPFIQISNSSEDTNAYNVFKNLEINDGVRHPIIPLRSTSFNNPSSPASPSSPTLESPRSPPPTSPFSPSPSFSNVSTPSLPNSFSGFSPTSPTYPLFGDFSPPPPSPSPVNGRLSPTFQENEDIITISDEEEENIGHTAEEAIIIESEDRRRLERVMTDSRQRMRDIQEQIRLLQEQLTSEQESYDNAAVDYSNILPPAQLAAFTSSIVNATEDEYFASVNRLNNSNTIPTTRGLNRHNLRR